MTKRLVLRERMRVRRVGTTERRLFDDTLRGSDWLSGINSPRAGFAKCIQLPSQEPSPTTRIVSKA